MRLPEGGLLVAQAGKYLAGIIALTIKAFADMRASDVVLRSRSRAVDAVPSSSRWLADVGQRRRFPLSQLPGLHATLVCCTRSRKP